MVSTGVPPTAARAGARRLALLGATVLALAPVAVRASGDAGRAEPAPSASEDPDAVAQEPASPAPSPPGAAETVVTSTRLAVRRDEQPRALTVVTQADLLARSVRSTPEALAETEGVYVQKTNPAGGTPYIRGLYGQHVLLLVDGVRMNNSTIRSGPNQFLNTLDPFLVDQVEVLRGPGSVLYGSDALGGVVNVRTFWPRFSDEPTAGGVASLRSASYDQSLQGHLRGTLSLPHTAAAIGVTGRDFNDLRGGALIGVQPYTAYEEWDAVGKLRHRLAPGQQLALQYQLVRQSNAARLDRSVPGDFRRFTQQFRDLVHARYEQAALGALHQVSVELSAHRQGDLSQRWRRARDRVDNDFATVWTWGARAEASARPQLGALAPTLTFGADLFYDRINGAASRVAISDPGAYTPAPLSTRYLFVSQALTGGAFARASTDPGAPLSGHAGVRGQLNRVAFPEDRRLRDLFETSPSPPPILPAEEILSAGLAAEAGAAYRPGQGLTVLVNFGSGFRAPSVDDYTRLGPEGPGFVLPARGLVPEQSYTAELGARFTEPLLDAEAFYAFTTVRGLIANVPARAGDATLTPDGLPYLTRQNRERADLHSAEVALNLRPLPQLSLLANASLVLARQVRRDLLVPGEPLIVEPLTRLPPLNGTVRVRHAPLDWLYAEAVVRWAGPQRAISSFDRLDNRICAEAPDCNGTDGYAALHLRGGVALGKQLTATVSFLNLLDATYRVHGSGVDEPGRSVAVSLEGRL